MEEFIALINGDLKKIPRKKGRMHEFLLKYIASMTDTDYNDVWKISECVYGKLPRITMHYAVVFKIMYEAKKNMRVVGVVPYQLWRYYMRSGVKDCYEEAKRLVGE